jgi:predicted TIM-barrel fold metal-dependent hydrolase
VDGRAGRLGISLKHQEWADAPYSLPDAIGMAIASIESADFLTEEQKRDILYNNAARFLRLGSR